VAVFVPVVSPPAIEFSPFRAVAISKLALRPSGEETGQQASAAL
jgi:hypothetical protein